MICFVWQSARMLGTLVRNRLPTVLTVRIWTSDESFLFLLASVECKHGAGPLFRDHARVDYSKSDESCEDKKADPELEGGDGVEADADEVATAISFTPCSPSVVAERLKKDVVSRGVWPVLASQAGCPVLEGKGMAKWREYRWVEQKFVDRKGSLQEKKTQVLKEITGSRQEFLATFKRKLLEWLPHRQHLLWDKKWQRKQGKRSTGAALVPAV